MDLEDFDLVASLQALPETDPIEVEGIQLGRTCNCDGLASIADTIQTVCVLGTC